MWNLKSVGAAIALMLKCAVESIDDDDDDDDAGPVVVVDGYSCRFFSSSFLIYTTSKWPQ